MNQFGSGEYALSMFLNKEEVLQQSINDEPYVDAAWLIIRKLVSLVFIQLQE